MPNKDIMLLTEAYKLIFQTNNLANNLKILEDKYKENELVSEVINFITKDKKDQSVLQI